MLININMLKTLQNNLIKTKTEDKKITKGNMRAKKENKNEG